MKHAERKVSATVVKDKDGNTISDVKRVSRPGKQKFKFEEILKRKQELDKIEDDRLAEIRKAEEELEFQKQQERLRQYAIRERK